MTVFDWTIVGVLLLGGLYALYFLIRLGRKQKALARAVELGLRHMQDKPLSADEQAELDEFCRRGVLRRVEAMDDGKPVTFYTIGVAPVRAELTT